MSDDVENMGSGPFVATKGKLPSLAVLCRTEAAPAIASLLAKLLGPEGLVRRLLRPSTESSGATLARSCVRFRPEPHVTRVLQKRAEGEHLRPLVTAWTWAKLTRMRGRVVST